MTANGNSPKLTGQQRRGHVVVGHVERAAGHRPQAEKQRQDVEEADAGDADDGALAGRRLVLHRVVANQNVRQRRRAAEQGDHQREEIELRSSQRRRSRHAGERRARAGREQVGAGGSSDRRRSSRLPSSSLIFSSVQVSISLSCSVARYASGPSGPVWSFCPGKLLDRADRPEVGLAFAVPLRQAVDIALAVLDLQASAASDGDDFAVLDRLAIRDDAARSGLLAREHNGLSTHSPRRRQARRSPPVCSWRFIPQDPISAFTVKSAVEDHHGQNRAEHDQQPAFDELHPRRRDHAGGDDDQHRPPRRR